MSDKLNILEPWYQEGLHFKCTGCGKCCTGFPGYVWVDQNEIDGLCKFLNISEELFRKQYTRLLYGRLSLKEHGKDKQYDCVFLKEGKCTVYPARPKQCRTFPWWDHNLSTPAAWEEAALACEGINHPEAPLVPYEEIEKNRLEN